MTTPYATELLAASRSAELRREAGVGRLVALARCCRPSALVRTARRWAAAAARPSAALRRERRPASCCAPARCAA